MKKILTALLLLTVHLSFSQNIATIQGTGDDSPYIDQEVNTSGIVTAVNEDAYFIQDGTNIRDGIYVYDQTYTPSVGDEIEITGTVVEFFNLTEIVNLTAFEVLSSANPLPAPIVLSTNDVNQEDYESMLVQVQVATCTNADIGFGEFQLNDGSGPCAVDDLFFLFSATENIDYTITGPVLYSFDNYKIVPRNQADIEIAAPLYFTVNPQESNITSNSLTITWETNIEANSIIEYGKTPALELGTVSDMAANISHELILENLEPATIYYVKAYSEAGADLTPSPVKVMATSSLSSGAIKVYFNHTVDQDVATISNAVYTDQIIDTIISYIDLAQNTLDFTMYEAQDKAIVEALNAAYDRGVMVRVISDDEGRNDTLTNYLNAAIPILEGNSEGIMHNKFMIVDQASTDNSWVLTGSMNHTVANLGWDYNNVICIQDESLAKAYVLEFEEMWGSDSMQPNMTQAKFGAQKSDNTPHHFRINGIEVESYFSPSDGVAKRIVKAIDAAESELAFAILVFTENSLGTAVLNAHNRGVDVKGIIDYVDFNGDEYNYLLGQGVNVKDYQNADGSEWPNGPTLHHKYAVIDYAAGNDHPLLITGSHNWTASAGSIHDENTLLIYDAEIANLYQQEFWARFFGIVISTNAPFLEKQLVVFPNPTNDDIQIDFPSDGQVYFYDQQGKFIFSKIVAQGIQSINLSTLSDGMYILRYENQTANYIERIIKMK